MKSDSLEIFNTIDMSSVYFEEAIIIFEKIGSNDNNRLRISFVLLITGLELYIKSKIFKKYRNNLALLTDCIQNYIGGTCYDFSCEANKLIIEKKQSFSHAQLPLELFKRYSIKLRFEGLIKWLKELYSLDEFTELKILKEFYDLRNLFIHYWEFPLNAQLIGEDGSSIKLTNRFEKRIESLDKKFLSDVFLIITKFINYVDDEGDERYIEILNKAIKNKDT